MSISYWGVFSVYNIRTLFLRIDVEFGRSYSRVTNSIVGDALDDAVVAPALDRFHPEDAAVRHVDDDVPLTPGSYSPTGLPPVDVGRRVAGRLAEEADHPAVDDALISWCQSDLGRV